jgi:methionyl-tRNA formyltransferase
MAEKEEQIIQEGAAVLRAKAEEIPLADIASPKIQKLIAHMRAVLETCADGVALAAPQVGESLRLFVVSPRAYEEGEDLSDEHLVYINPKITKLSSKKIELDEGCLSVRNVYGKIVRSERATITAHDETGKLFSRGASDLLAEIFQHEVDHLDGKLFIDTAQDLRTVVPKNAPRIAFFGTPEFAVHVADELEAKEIIPTLVITAPDKKVGRSGTLTAPAMKTWATERHIPVLQPEKLSEIKDELAEGDFDLFIVAAYGKIIPQTILDLPKKGALNVHPSLLPLHRGASPIQSTILAGDTQTGVSIMLLDAEMDHGPILAVEKLTLGEWQPSTPELSEKLAIMGGKLLARKIPKWLEGGIEPKTQDDSAATFTKKISTADAEISQEHIFPKITPEADRTIRGLFPNPGAFSIIKTRSGKDIRVKLVPGQRVIPEGKKEMSMSDFKRGYL